MERYDAIALTIVPKRRDRSRSELRTAIAKALAAEVTAALDEQRVKQFPEIGALTASIQGREAKLTEAEAAVRQREAVAKAREDRLAAFLKAFDAYAAWLSGDGEVDENGKRFDALRAACESFKKEFKR